MIFENMWLVHVARSMVYELANFIAIRGTNKIMQLVALTCTQLQSLKNSDPSIVKSATKHE